MKKLIIILLAVIALFFLAVRTSAEGQDTCPTTSGWTKIDSNDISLYPVAEATDYCFKAGSDNSRGCTGGLFDEIPEGGFSQPYCGLSHWAYFVPTTSPSPSPTDSPIPSPTASPTLTPSPTATANASPTPSPIPSNSPSPIPNDPGETLASVNKLAETGTFEENFYLSIILLGLASTILGARKLTKIF